MKTTFKILVALTAVSLAVAQCPAFTCNSTTAGPNEICKAPLVNSTSVLTVCTGNQQCPLSLDDASANPGSLSCRTQNNPKTLKFPGQYCSADIECGYANKTCVNGICAGLGANETCTDATQCNMGLTCRTNRDLAPPSTFQYCLYPVNATAYCDKPTDCSIGHDCQNNACIKFFSLENGASPVVPEYSDHRVSLCASGLVDNNNKCSSFRLANGTLTTCKVDTDCVYNVTAADGTNNTGATFTKVGTCVCGYNTLGNRYCKVGSTNDGYIQMVNTFRDAMNNTSNCHVVERDPTSCYNNIYNKDGTKSASYSTVKTQRNLLASQINSVYRPLVGPNQPGTCVYKMLFPTYSDDFIPPNNKNCPAYRCEKNIDNRTCVSAVNPNLENNENITAILYTDSCVNNTRCIYNKNAIQSGYRVDGVCQAGIDVKPIRFAGEPCDDTTVCQYGNCTNGKCTAKTKGDDCSADGECNVGLFCDNRGASPTNKCASQKSAGTACTSEVECVNSNTCYNSVCTLVRSIESSDNVTVTGDAVRACKYHAIGDKCVNLKYENEKDKNSDGYINCTLGSTCRYLDVKTNASYTNPCECGYSTSGQAVCALPSASAQSRYDDYATKLQKSLDNSCHTANKYICLHEGRGRSKAANEAADDSIYAHLFYKAPSCAKAVISSSYIQISATFVLALISLLFI